MIEYANENDVFQHLGSVVTNSGYSDWATTEIPADIKSMWYRLSRREDDFCIECSEDSSFKAVFTNMEVTECMWLAHDGQQPDEKQVD